MATKAILAVAALAGVSASPKISSRDLSDLTYESYIQRFNIQIDPKDEATKREIFNAELARVTKHNSGNASWKETLNRFSILTPAEKQAFFGEYVRNFLIKYISLSQNVL